MKLDELGQSLAPLAAHMNKIERRIKEAEQVREEAVIAAINEVRYAGRRFVDAWALSVSGNLTETQLETLRDHLTVAKQYLENADHDITDAICLFVHTDIDRLKKRYGEAELAKAYPDYFVFAVRMDEANAIVAGSREDRNARASKYTELETDYIPALLAAYKVLKRAERPVLKKSRYERWKALIWSLLSIAGTVLAFFLFDDGWSKISPYLGTVRSLFS